MTKKEPILNPTSPTFGYGQSLLKFRLSVITLGQPAIEGCKHPGRTSFTRIMGAPYKKLRNYANDVLISSRNKAVRKRLSWKTGTAKSNVTMVPGMSSC